MPLKSRLLEILSTHSALRGGLSPLFTEACNTSQQVDV